MNLNLIKQILRRLKKFSWVIALIALLFGIIFFLVARQSVKIYTSHGTLFPLNSMAIGDAQISGSISNILGLTDAPKSFSGDASINIVELATSRYIREAVASSYAIMMPSLKNKQIARLLIEENNLHSGYLQNNFIKTNELDSVGFINVASDLLKDYMAAKINKNGILELNFSNNNPDIVQEVSYIYVRKLGRFYIDLKKKKSQSDYEFAIKKVDSLKTVLADMDQQNIHLDETTFFTNNTLKRFTTPKINLEQQRQTLSSQYFYAVNNREAAAYRLQKETPIIEALDKPDPPYEFIDKSRKKYALGGMFFGAFLGILFVTSKILIDYIKKQLIKLEKPTELKIQMRP